MPKTPVYMIMKYLASRPSIYSLHNDHYGLTGGEPNYWDEWSNSPIFPVNEQPESADFYILYRFIDSIPRNSWWHLDTGIMLFIYSNNIKLISDMSMAIIDELADYEFASKRVNQWAADNNVDGPPINWISYRSSEDIESQKQENGVYMRGIRLDVNSVLC